MKGTIKTWHHRKGFGFIAIENGEDIFLHITDIPDKQKPEIGESVVFDVGPGRDGKTKAINVRLANQSAAGSHQASGDDANIGIWIGVAAVAALIVGLLIFLIT